MSIPDPKGYYAALELQPNASPALIRAAYRVRAMELHPDRNDSPFSTLDFQRVQEAFDVLGDPQRKAAYDASALRAAAAASTARPAAPPTATSPAAAPRPSPAPRRSPRIATPATLAAAVGLAVVVGWWWLDSDDQAASSRRPVARPRPTATAVDPLLLAARSQALPSSGILQLNLPSDAFAEADKLPRFKLVAPRDASYLVKLSEWDSNRAVMTVFVRAGDTTEVLVPTGRYRIRLASGVAWYGDALRFGPTTQYAQVDTLSEFKPIGNRPARIELALERFSGADASSTAIPASQF